jgi:hypothetical protein
MQHHDLANGRWWELSIAEQLGNIGSEVSRAIRWKSRNPQAMQAAVFRAFELFDLTLADPRYLQSRCRLREIARAREVVGDFFLADNQFQWTAEALQKYFDAFAVAARNERA